MNPISSTGTQPPHLGTWPAALIVLLACACGRPTRTDPRPTPDVSTGPEAAPLEPTPPAPPAPDHRLRLAVRHALLFDPNVRVRDVEVEARAGVITLTGTLDTLLAIRRAAQAAGGVEGVVAVDNQLQVRPIERTDSEVQMDVEQGLRFEPRTQRADIHVAVEAGVVTLQGTIADDRQREAAEHVALGVRGVLGVHNELREETPASPDDAPPRDSETRGGGSKPHARH